MGLNFRKSKKIGKGTRINFSKSGIGISTGVKGFRVGVGPKGVRKTASIPGTGIYSTKQKSWNSIDKGNKEERVYETYDGKTVNLDFHDDMMMVLNKINPTMPSKPIKFLIAGIIFLILGFINVLFLPVSLILIITSLLMMMICKEARVARHVDKAKKNMIKYDFVKAEEECNKVLKIDGNNEAAKTILDFMAKAAEKYI